MVNIVLASKSKVRKQILYNNGINCIVEPANIDEDFIKESLLKEGATPEVAQEFDAGAPAHLSSKLFSLTALTDFPH